MSFSISFTARTIHSARQKLHEAYAPACVKALVEKALDAIPAWLLTPPLSGGEAKQPEFCGVFVEAWGHIEDHGAGKSWIDRFVVQPLFD